MESHQRWEERVTHRRNWKLTDTQSWQTARSYQVQAVVLLFTRKTWKTLKIMCFYFALFYHCFFLFVCCCHCFHFLTISLTTILGNITKWRKHSMWIYLLTFIFYFLKWYLHRARMFTFNYLNKELIRRLLKI